MFGTFWKISKSNNRFYGSLESDAVVVNKLGGCPTNEEIGTENFGTGPNNFISPLSLPERANDSELNTESTTSVNQQVVVHFSNINGLQIGSTYNINNMNTVDKLTPNVDKDRKYEKKKYKYPKTVTIEEMMKSQDEPNIRILTEIATHLGSDYKMFMRELGFSDGQISAMHLDHSAYGLKELLLDWERNTDGERTLGYLTALLWNCGYRECVHRVKSVWKSEFKNNALKH